MTAARRALEQIIHDACEISIEDHLGKITEAARQPEWTKADAAAAISAVADNYVMKLLVCQGLGQATGTPAGQP